MTRLIDVDKLRQYIDDCEYCEKCDTKSSRCYVGCELPDCVTPQWERVLNEQQTVEAQPVRHGKWDYVTVVDEGFWRCSNCGTPSEALGARKLYKYCPFCGAKMDAEQEKAE